MKYKTIVFMILMIFGFESLALQISLNNPPGDYRVYRLSGSSLTKKTYAEAYQKFSFTVPDRFIVKNSDGSTDFLSSLQKWRRNTPIADGNPRTRNGIGYYPFKDSRGKNRYIALEHIYNNRPGVVAVKSDQLSVDISGSINERPPETAGETTASDTSVNGQLNPLELARRSGADDQRYSIDVSGNTTPGKVLGSELTSSLRPVSRPSHLEYARVGVFNEEFPPRTAAFAKDTIEGRRTAARYTNTVWRTMSYKEQAEYMHKKYDQLARAHNMRSTYDPKILVCQAYKESTFRPQIRTKNSRSTASGISQITRSTAIDTFSRGRWFRSKVEGFTNIKSGGAFHSRMAGSMLAQMEFGMAIMEQKRRDNGLSRSSQNISKILAKYYGSGSSSNNNKYAKDIIDCVRCVNRESGYSFSCLEIARTGV